MENLVNTDSLILETDWLASTPFFYNRNLRLASTHIYEVMPTSEPCSFHPEGLYNYLDFGYSVFGQTPIADVCFMPPAARLHRTDEGSLELARLADPVEQWWDYRLTEDDVIDLIRERVQTWEATLPSEQEIVLPLSGGFDSRLLLWCLRDKSRVRAYTYGLSEDQDRSTEVVHARALAQRFDVRWERISMGDQHRFFSDWDAAFGISTHAHGMYHFEFYTKIRERLAGEQAFLSGIIGDVWAGSIPARQLKRSNELVQLGYTHGLRADPQRLRLAVSHELRDQFWFDHQEQLSDHRFQVITSMRLKLMLLSYLMRVPRLFNFQPWTPYLDIDIAMAMLNLPAERRLNRQWQRDFFVKVGLDLENQGLKSSRSNSLNHQAMRRQPVDPLDVEKLSKLFDRDYIDWINRKVCLTPLSDLRTKVLSVPKVGGAFRRLGIRDVSLQAYCAYLCLRPVEKLL
ncbi:MAG: hypothetical protein K9L82_11805 [Chromatiaceae bacterium]|nr:hypothetical protein [Chromatiaceae bacterium]MCF7994143.1 hypothetical protein [Chromatiaceae bacterium]MCF8016212.1 hypothetical protein [Chromatiaceae bacterium]